MFKHMLNLYIQYLIIKLKVLRISRSEEQVSKAMYHLNHFAKERYDARGYIYKLKNELIRLWHQRGYCTNVSWQKQTLDCWSCAGTGGDDYHCGCAFNDDECPFAAKCNCECQKCGGTGIYAQHRLCRFEFTIARQNYVWHQPERLVDWIVTSKDYESLDEFVPDSSETEEFDIDIVAEYYCIICQYLSRNGVKNLPNLKTLADVLRFFPGSTRYITWKWKRSLQIRNLKKLWIYSKTGTFPEDDIPF